MGRSKHRFGGINTDLSPMILPSGKADQAVNVEIYDRTLRKRAGFSQYEDAVAGSASILSSYVAHFANGTTYIFVKLDTGLLYYRKRWPSPEASFTNISLSALGYTSNRHSTTDKGWWFSDSDRVYYFDSVGGTKILPDLSVKKAGLPKPTNAPVIEATIGRKDGSYHVCWAYVNTLTDDVGVVSEMQSPAVECRQYDNTGGILVTNFSNINAAAYADNVKYEWDRVYSFCTMGDTEYIGLGGVGEECFSYRNYRDSTLDADHQGGAGDMHLYKADHEQRDELLFSNAGGEPPGAQIGCFTGLRGIYGRVYHGTAFVEERIEYSVPRHPCMVPQPVQYDITDADQYKFDPQPYEGTIYSGIQGNATALEYGGGITGYYTDNATYTIRGDGRLFASMRSGSLGCAAIGASVGTPGGIHALGDAWTVLSSNSFIDLSNLRFENVLKDIPVAYKGLSRMAHYGYKDQIWCAVTKDGGTKAQRILVWDENMQELVMFDIAGLSTAGITHMVELVHPGATPTMLVCLDNGRILEYPDGTDDNGTDFAANWRGYFGQERREFDQRLLDAQLVAGDNCKDNVTIGVRSMRSSDETVTQVDIPLVYENTRRNIGTNFNKVDGAFYQLEVSSTASVTTQWEIKDFVLVLGRTDRR